MSLDQLDEGVDVCPDHSNLVLVKANLGDYLVSSS